MKKTRLSIDRLNEILNKFPQRRLCVIGDFFLDYYLVTDKQKSERSLETGLEAFQVTSTRKSPGAAGTVASILRHLDVEVVAIGFTGDDGNGFDLRQQMNQLEIDTTHMYISDNRSTPTYMKPMLKDGANEIEMSRFDIKNHFELDSHLESLIIKSIHEVIDNVDGVVVLDQVTEQNCGVITDKVRSEISSLGRSYPNKFVFADSRSRIGLFRDVILKCNIFEAHQALGISKNKVELINYAKIAQHLYKKNRKPVLLTLGEKGIQIANERENFLMPALPTIGEIDIVGAGDSVMAAISAALCSGAGFKEAGYISMIVASIIIHQIGTTGIVTRKEISELYKNIII